MQFFDAWFRILLQAFFIFFDFDVGSIPVKNSLILVSLLDRLPMQFLCFDFKIKKSLAGIEPTVTFLDRLPMQFLCFDFKNKKSLT